MLDKPSEVPCEVCGAVVEFDTESGSGGIIEFYNLVPEYREYYGFCEAHKPDEEMISVVKDRIRRGEHPVVPQ